MPFTPNYDNDRYFVPDEDGKLIPFSRFWKNVEQPSTIPKSPNEYRFECVYDHRFKNQLSNQNVWSRFSNSALLMDRWHYTHSSEVMPKYVFGIFHPDGYDMSFSGQSGVIMYGRPAMNHIYMQYCDDPDGIIELRRMVLVNATPKNTESWFLAKSLKWLADNTGETIVVTYADPVQGHTGNVYKACNFDYDGLSANTVVVELPDGHFVHDRLLRCRTKHGSYTQRALELRELLQSGKARYLERPSKNRFHYHLDKSYSCKACSTR